MARKWKDFIPILNEYQATTDYSFQGFRLGTDRTYNYSHEKESFLMIADKTSEMTVSFKSFLKDFNISFKFDANTIKNVGGGQTQEVKSVGVTYNVSIDIPAVSVDDAMVNAARLDAIMIMLDKTVAATPPSTPSSSEGIDSELGQNNGAIEERKFVLLSNMINNGKYTSVKNIRTYKDLIKYALECQITKFDFSPNLEMGFFEYDYKSKGMRLFPKVFEASFEIIALIKPSDGTNNYLFHPFNSDGSVNDINEITKKNASWPFGVKTK